MKLLDIHSCHAVSINTCEAIPTCVTSYSPLSSFGAHNLTAVAQCSIKETQTISNDSKSGWSELEDEDSVVPNDTLVQHEEKEKKNDEERYSTLEKWRDSVYSDIEREKKKDDSSFIQRQSPVTTRQTDRTVLATVEEEKRELCVSDGGQELNLSVDGSLVHNLSKEENHTGNVIEKDNTSVPIQSNSAKEMCNVTLRDEQVFSQQFESNWIQREYAQDAQKVCNEDKRMECNYFIKLLQLVNKIVAALVRKFRHEPSETVSQDGFNFASVDAGARVLAANKGSTGAKNILHEDKDKYMLSPCKYNRWVVIELSEEILLKRVEVANFEYFSSFPEHLVLLGSQRFPTDKWILLQVAPFNQTRDIQYFELRDDAFIRYLKILFIGVQGREYFCTVSLVRVFGKRLVDDWKEALEQSNKDRNVAAGVIASLKKSTFVSNDSALDGRNAFNSSPTALESNYSNNSFHDSSYVSNASGFGVVVPEHLKKEHHENFQNISAFSEAVEESIFRQLTRMLRQLELNQTLVSQYVELHLAEYAASLSDAKEEAMVARQKSQVLERRLERLEDTTKRVWLVGMFGWTLFFGIFVIGLVSSTSFLHSTIHMDIWNLFTSLKTTWNRLSDKLVRYDGKKKTHVKENASNGLAKVRESRSRSTGQLFAVCM